LAHGAFQIAPMWGAIATSDEWRLVLDSSNVDRDRTSHGGAYLNYGGVRDPVIDRAFAQALDPRYKSVQNRNYRLIQTRLNRRAYWIPLFYDFYVVTVGSRVHDFTFGPHFGPDWQSGRLSDAYRWRLADR
jgi:ABC-type transport system substrate-binding protein